MEKEELREMTKEELRKFFMEHIRFCEKKLDEARKQQNEKLWKMYFPLYTNWWDMYEKVDKEIKAEAK